MTLEQQIETAAQRGAERALEPILAHIKTLTTQGPLLLTVTEACEYVGGNLSDTTARGLIATGAWVGFRLSEGGKIYVDRASVDAWVRRQVSHQTRNEVANAA